jgi:hypothetical protein
MNGLRRRTTTSPLTPEGVAAFRRLLRGMPLVVAAEQAFVLRDPALEVMVSVWPTEEDADVAVTPEDAVPRGALRPPAGATIPLLDAFFQQGRAAATPETLHELAALLGDADPLVRASAARAARHLGAAAATPDILTALLLLLRDPEAVVRDTAAAALGGMGSVAATPEVVAVLSPLVFDRDFRIASAAAQVVERLGCAEAVEACLRQPSALAIGTEADTDPVAGAQDQPAERFNLLLSAFDPDGRRVALDDLTLHALGRTEAGLMLRISQRTARGDLTLEGLPSGVSFELRCPTVRGESVDPVQLPSKVKGWAAASVEEGSTGAEPVYESVDGRLCGLVRLRDDSITEIIFESADPALAEAVVWFALMGESGLVAQEGEVRLGTRIADNWQGVWAGSVKPTEPCRLVFAVGSVE